jgi:hypothetical protein
MPAAMSEPTTSRSKNTGKARAKKLKKLHPVSASLSGNPNESDLYKSATCSDYSDYYVEVSGPEVASMMGRKLPTINAGLPQSV